LALLYPVKVFPADYLHYSIVTGSKKPSRSRY